VTMLGRVAGCNRDLPGAHSLKEKHMNIIVYAIAAFFALAGSALAQQATPAEQLDQARGFIAGLENQRNDAQNKWVVEHAATLKAQGEVAKLTKENAELKAKLPSTAKPAPLAK